jgi:hypothetical protein
VPVPLVPVPDGVPLVPEPLVPVPLDPLVPVPDDPLVPVPLEPLVPVPVLVPVPLLVPLPVRVRSVSPLPLGRVVGLLSVLFVRVPELPLVSVPPVLLRCVLSSQPPYASPPRASAAAIKIARCFCMMNLLVRIFPC